MGKKENMITVIVVEPGKKPYVKEIENTLESLQREVSGYIQTIYPFEEPVAIVCAECGKLEGLPLNRALRDEGGEVYDIIAWNFLVVGLTEDSFGSLSNDRLKEFTKRFEMSELFINYNGKILVAPYEHIAS